MVEECPNCEKKVNVLVNNTCPYCGDDGFATAEHLV